MDDILLHSRNGDVTTITLNRPTEGNRVSSAMGARLSELFAAASEDGSKAIVLRANGPDFCTGRDTKGLHEDGATTALGIRTNNTDPALRFYDSFLETPIPIIGVVQGMADGMGCALAALCDITIVADNARFRVPEMNRDIPPALVMTAFRDRVPRKAMAYLVYSRDEIDASAAREFGIASKIVPEAELDSAVNELTDRLSENSMAALRLIKEYLNEALHMDRRAAISFASNILSNVMSSR